MQSFLIAVNAVVPFLCYIAFGFLVKKLNLVTTDFMTRLNQLIFKAFFPITMFYNLYNREEGTILDWKLPVVGLSSVLILTFILFLIVPRLVPENERRGVLIQAVFRSNFVLFAAPLAVNIFGDSAASEASMMIALVVPLYNVLAIVVLEHYHGGKVSGLELLKKILGNPLIQGAIVGLIAMLIGLKLPACVEKPIKQFADLTTPLALFILGSTLKFSSIRKNARYLVSALFAKLVAVPAIALVVAHIVHLTGLEQFIYFAMFATPIATSSFPMAANMGGDGDLAGELVVLSTVFSVITLFLWIFFMDSVGILGV